VPTGYVVAIAAYWVDQRVLVRLYPFFHAGLGVLSFAAADFASNDLASGADELPFGEAR